MAGAAFWRSTRRQHATHMFSTHFRDDPAAEAVHLATTRFSTRLRSQICVSGRAFRLPLDPFDANYIKP